MTFGRREANMFSVDELKAGFKDIFGGEPFLVRAPGRVNLIGEHTDYNDGFIMPAALEYETRAAVAPRADRILRVHSTKIGVTKEFDLDDPAPQPKHDWTDYVFGVAVALAGAGKRLKGADIMIASSVPFGSGLSSSAALEVSIGYSLLTVAGLPIDTVELAKLCQKAENEFVGMRCGIMDQFISCNGQHDHALMIDCRSLEKRSVPIDPRARIVVANSMVHHELASGEYNKRRASCEEAVRLLAPALGPIKALRDVTPTDLEANKALLSEVTYRRARHIVTENERVIEAAEALAAGDLARCGALMNLSHASMRDDYEISCDEVDVLVDIAQKQSGVFGSRMTGGGFGGCTVSLVEAGAVESFMENVKAAYETATGLKSTIFACSPQQGVGPLAG
ncbi:galactokinase [Pleomorphomonas sp. JP5]|uniref:galactokinase n=1 Tax=Pleomorphomonas sp. JP5 TaxID=2942998 RepID=UPI002042C4F8|nr:galactokinase [Pleomorphomonas sp. JP5]MCM5556262.1 galactokinase [Pleomorphomonas sp. JP5]